MRSLRTPILVTLFLLAGLNFGCAPPPPQGDESGRGSDTIPELTKELIDERINDARVYEILPESGRGEPISWGFDWDEPKEITVVDKQIQGTRAFVILDIKTRSSERAHVLRQLAGQIRTEWELKTGWVIRRWELVETENISMKYKDVLKADQNSNGTSKPGSSE